MNASSNAMPGSLGAPSAALPAVPQMRLFYWSVMREVWEYRSLYLAPLIVAGVIVFASSLSMLAGIWEPALRSDPNWSMRKFAQPYDFAAMLIMGVAFVVAIFYCLDAMHGERRDRSILFWKSLPVSDRMTVLAKAAIPLVVLPLVAFVITVTTHVVMVFWNALVNAVSGGDVTRLWNHLPLFRMWVMLAYHLFAVHGLWYAPIYGWLLLVSAWAKRSPFLWAVIPVALVAIVDRIVFQSNSFLNLLGHRVMGGPAGDFGSSGDVLMPPLSQMTPGRFLASPGLWVGFGLTAVFLAMAVWLRRQREPV